MRDQCRLTLPTNYTPPRSSPSRERVSQPTDDCVVDELIEIVPERRCPFVRSKELERARGRVRKLPVPVDDERPIRGALELSNRSHHVLQEVRHVLGRCLTIRVLVVFPLQRRRRRRVSLDQSVRTPDHLESRALPARPGRERSAPSRHGPIGLVVLCLDPLSLGDLPSLPTDHEIGHYLRQRLVTLDHRGQRNCFLVEVSVVRQDAPSGTELLHGVWSEVHRHVNMTTYLERSSLDNRAFDAR